MGAEVVNFEEVNVHEALTEMTGGIGPDSCIDAVGMESHGISADNMLDKAKAAVGLATDRRHALRQVILACRKGGHVSIPGVYGGMADKFPIGALMEKGLFVATGQTHVQKYSQKLLKMILDDKLDTTFLISHRLPLEQAAHGYKISSSRRSRIRRTARIRRSRRHRRTDLAKPFLMTAIPKAPGFPAAVG